jgi:tRNA (mo5U34)-methyltransferase
MPRTRAVHAEENLQTSWTPELIRKRVRELGDWFHNLNLGGVQTAPNHFLGDYPAVKWSRFSQAIAPDLRGKTVLDIGCNAGFYSLEMKRRGADRVVGIDPDEHYLKQARFAAEVRGVDIDFRKLGVYEVEQLGEKFDLVLFLGVFYHLRYPLLALDLLRHYAAKDVLVVQSMLRGATKVESPEPDYPIWETEIFSRPGFPQMYFIERRYSSDPTNWWIPNTACLEAMLRSAGFEIIAHPESEIFVTRISETAEIPPEPVIQSMKVSGESLAP